MKKMVALTTVFFAGMYGDNVWDFIRQWAPSLAGDGFGLNIQRLSGLAGATGVVGAAVGGVGLVVTTIMWCCGSAGDEESQKALWPISSVTAGLLALCALGAGTYVMIPEPGDRARARTVEVSSQSRPHEPVDVRRSVTLRSVTIGNSVISVDANGELKVADATSN